MQTKDGILAGSINDTCLIIDAMFIVIAIIFNKRTWSGGAMLLGILAVQGRIANLNYSMARPTAIAVWCGWGCLNTFSFV